MCKIGNDAGVTQSCCATGAGHRLEAYATLLLGLADPDQASFKILGEQYCA
jgi:hypothetical protein